MSSSDDGPYVLIAALSGRALAACARRAGYRPLVADLFGDLDTRDIATAHERVPGSLGRGLAATPLLAALDRLATGRDVIGVATGAGFEHRPALLRRLAARYVLLGNAADSVAAVKDPFAFAAACARAGVAHPEIRRERPAENGWLRKQVAGAGGGHVVNAREGRRPKEGKQASSFFEKKEAKKLFPGPAAPPEAATEPTGMRQRKFYPAIKNKRIKVFLLLFFQKKKILSSFLCPFWPLLRHYYQRQVAGDPVSVCFLAAGGACRILGLSRQWPDPAPNHPFRYGGAVRPAPDRAAELGAAVARLVAQHTGLCGLNSADFLRRPDGFDLLEINPRPGASLDIFAAPDNTLFRLHCDACAGKLPDSPPCWPDAAAAAVVYAPADIELPADFVWPDWTADRQPPGEKVPRGAPLCTVLADATDAATAERRLRDRAGQILARLPPQGYLPGSGEA